MNDNLSNDYYLLKWLFESIRLELVECGPASRKHAHIPLAWLECLTLIDKHCMCYNRNHKFWLRYTFIYRHYLDQIQMNR